MICLTLEGIVRSIYDPAGDPGGLISSGMEYVHELNPKARLAPFGQQLNPESYAICEADMLIKGQDVSKIRLGNTLSHDQLAWLFFDYIASGRHHPQPAMHCSWCQYRTECMAWLPGMTVEEVHRQQAA